jgi:hypothetical protein
MFYYYRTGTVFNYVEFLKPEGFPLKKTITIIVFLVVFVISTGPS